MSLEIEKKVLENAASVTAKILNDFGWDTSKLRQHYDWTSKNCPRILRNPTAYNGKKEQTWDWFKERVESYL